MIEPFGRHADGSEVKKITISNGRATASVLTYGASLQDLRLIGHPHSLVLGFSDFGSYQRNPYFGAMVGRVSNRISGGSFNINDETFETDKNWLGKHTLHGGSGGIDKLNWDIVEHSSDRAVLRVTDTEENSGFPGDLEVFCEYKIADDGSLVIETTATCTKDTLCNIAHHSYFNLSGGNNILDHELQIFGESYLPVDDELIPTGEIKSVHNTDFDFRRSRKINAEKFIDFDHNFCFPNPEGSEIKMAILKSLKNGISMTIRSTECGLQVYSGCGIDVKSDADGSIVYAPYQAIALEPQSWPDGINKDGFPDGILPAGKTYFQRTSFSFNRS